MSTNYKPLLALAFGLFIAIGVLVRPFGAPAVLVGGTLAAVAGFIISRYEHDKSFLLNVLIAGLIVRVTIGTLIFTFELQEFFGGDAFTYDQLGAQMLRSWQGKADAEEGLPHYAEFSQTFPGILYLVASVYAVAGRNMLAVQFVNAVTGAATAPVIYLCAQHIFRNLRVARLSALFTAFFPSLALWSSQGLKDGPIVLLLALIMLATLRLGERMSVKYLLILAFSLFAVLSLRFYIFYMMVVAVAASFVIGMRAVSAQSLVRQSIAVVCTGLALTYMGVLRSADRQIGQFADLKVVQQSRSDLVKKANTAFGADLDVSTPTGALAAIPLGLTYLLLAPFPWQVANLRQSITLPEMLIWWASIPLLMLGLWFTLKFRLRQSLPILLFTLMLTLSYSIFQGNVGTAYRQRAQLLAFYFIYVAAGCVLLKERGEDQRLLDRAERERERAAAAVRIRRRDRNVEWGFLADRLSGALTTTPRRERDAEWESLASRLSKKAGF